MNFEKRLPKKAMDSIALSIGTCSLSGILLPAPGSVGSFIGIFFYLFCFSAMGILEFFISYTIVVVFSVFVCGMCERILLVNDPAEVNLDECVAMPLCYLPMQNMRETSGIAAFVVFLVFGFLLFRVLDIYKPFGIAKLQKFHGGLGIVIDDLAAAVLTALAITASIYITAT
jgi:phosphatidylglycerophosphatase A